MTIGRELARLGCRFISGNTRGHDIASFVSSTDGSLPTRGAGSAWSAVSHAAAEARLWSPENGEPGIATIRCPVLAFFGTREPHGEAALDTLRQGLTGTPRVETRLVPDADHFYNGCEATIARVIAEWAVTLS